LRRRNMEQCADLRHPHPHPGIQAVRPVGCPNAGEGMSPVLRRIPWFWVVLAVALAYPLVPGLDGRVFELTGQPVGGRLATIFVYAILALGLNVVVGNAGLLHIGIGAFFGVGAYLTGILMVQEYPFEREIPPEFAFVVCVGLSTVGSALLAVVLS